MEQLMKKSSDSRQAWPGDFLYTIKLPGLFETGGYSERVRINRESTLCCLPSVPAAGICCPGDVLVDVGVLPKEKYEDWRFGKVRYLEAVCTCNLKKLSFIMKQIRSYAKKSNLKPSFCYYKRWGVKKKHGHKPVIPLRFSKSGNPDIEKAYATHYVDLGRAEQLKKEKMEKAAAVQAGRLDKTSGMSEMNISENNND